MSFKYIDGIAVINAGGEDRKLAALKPDPKMLHGIKRFGEVRPRPNPATWQECDWSFFGSPVRDQKTYGSCTGHAGVCALDIIYRKQGKPSPLLSCTFPYGLVNGGRDNGASVTSILKVLREVGTCLHSEVGTDQIYKHQFPRQAWKTAEKYRVVEYLLCQTYEELCEAINLGFPVALGITVGQNFNRLDRYGVCPLPDVAVGGHALCGIGLKKHPVNNTWIMKIQNSWGRQWGMDGFAYLTKGHFDWMVDGYAIMHNKLIDTPPAVPKAAKPEEIVVQIEPTTPEVIPVSGGDSLLEKLQGDSVKTIAEEEDEKALDQLKTEPAAEEPQLTILEANASMVHTDPEGVMKLGQPKSAGQTYRQGKKSRK
jgi:hypothetical protein